MRHYSSLEGVYLQDTWLTIGTFDGVHRGHQEIVRRLAAGAHASGCQAAVLTFYPHPAVVLGKRTAPFYLTTPEERAALLGACGADVVVTYPFDARVAATSAHDFMADLVTHLGVRHLLVGVDFALGKLPGWEDPIHGLAVLHAAERLLRERETPLPDPS